MKNIPKILHLYWDKTPMSLLQTFTVETFHNLNPDWVINVYIPLQSYKGNDTYIPDYIGIDYFYIIENLNYVNIININLDDYTINKNLHNILRSDIFRYYILYEKGGMWSDFDVIWLKPMNHMNNIEYYGDVKMNKMKSIVCMFDSKIQEHLLKVNNIFNHNTFHNISVMISSVKNDFIKSLIDETIKIQSSLPKDDQPNHQLFGTLMLNKLYPNYFDITNLFNDVINLKYETIFPYSIFNMKSLYYENDLNYINNNVMCIHWFNGHPYSKDYVNNDGFNRDCTMTTILRNEGII